MTSLQTKNSLLIATLDVESGCLFGFATLWNYIFLQTCFREGLSYNYTTRFIGYDSIQTR